MENARDVTIKLHHRIGKYVQVHLYFALRWIMLSEVTFVTGKPFDGSRKKSTHNDCLCTHKQSVGQHQCDRSSGYDTKISKPEMPMAFFPLQNNETTTSDTEKKTAIHNKSHFHSQ